MNFKDKSAINNGEIYEEYKESIVKFYIKEIYENIVSLIVIL